MKRYNKGIFGLYEAQFGDYCLYNDIFNARHGSSILDGLQRELERKQYNIERLERKQYDKGLLKSKILGLTGLLDKKNELLTNTIILLTENLTGNEKDALTKKLYGIKDDSTCSTINMVHNNPTEIIQECQSIY